MTRQTVDESSSNNAQLIGVVAQQITDQLQSAFNPTHLEVLNESHQHNVPVDAETHFKVTMVSHLFETIRSVKRHQMVYAELQALLAGPIHALALHTYTPEEWSERSHSPASPACFGGSQHDR